MGIQLSNTNENVSFLSDMKLILEKGDYKVYENQQYKKYDYQEYKSSQNSFKDELEVAQEIQNQNFPGIVKIEQIQVQKCEKWFTSYYNLCVLTEHPTYSLKEYLQKKEKTLQSQQIKELLHSIVGAQHMLGVKKQYLSLDNIYTSDGKCWKLKPFAESESQFSKLMEYKAEKIVNFELDGFPAPEEFECKVFDSDRVQIFGLGMIILELITKQKSSHIYQDYKFNDALLSQHLQILFNMKEQFNQKFINIIAEMVDIDLVRRPNFKQLIKNLQSSKIMIIQTKIENIQEIPKLTFADSVSLFDSKMLKNKKEEQKLSQALEKAQIQITDSIKKMKYDQQNINNAQTKIEQNGQKYIGQMKNNLYDGLGRLFSKKGDLIYEGEFQKGQFHNWGIQYFYNTIQLQDSYDFSNCKDIMKYAKQYEGCFFQGMKHGDGKLILTNKECYFGDFKNDQISGFGQFERLQKDKVIGIWDNGVLKSTPGFSKEMYSYKSPHFSNQSQNQDEFQNQPLAQINTQDIINQQAKLGFKIQQQDFNGISKLQSCKSQLQVSINIHKQYFQQKTSQNKKDHKIYYDEAKTILKYEGQLFTGQMHGRGTLYFKNGDIHYEGNFVTGKFEGFGILFNEKPEVEMNINYHDLRDINIKGWWKKYEGTFQKGEKQGYGYWYLTDESVLLGIFENDQMHGEGLLKRPTLQDVYALWLNGILQSVTQGVL